MSLKAKCCCKIHDSLRTLVYSDKNLHTCNHFDVKERFSWLSVHFSHFIPSVSIAEVRLIHNIKLWSNFYRYVSRTLYHFHLNKVMYMSECVLKNFLKVESYTKILFYRSLEYYFWSKIALFKEGYIPLIFLYKFFCIFHEKVENL